MEYVLNAAQIQIILEETVFVNLVISVMALTVVHAIQHVEHAQVNLVMHV